MYLAHEKIESYKDSVHIHTDAFKTQENRTSVAFCIPDLHTVMLTDNGSLYLSVTPKFYTKVLHQTTGLTPNSN